MTDATPAPSPAPAPTPPPDANPSPPAAPARPRRRVLRAALLISVALLLGLYLAATRGFIARWVVMRELESQLGAEARADSVALLLDGRIEISGLRIANPDLSGTHRNFFEARSVTIRTPWWKAAGAPIRSITVDGQVLRISQSIKNRSLNARLITDSSKSGAIPPITVRSGVLEIGEHDVPVSPMLPDGYRVLERIDIAGAINPAGPPGAYGVSLLEQGKGDEGLRIEGGFDAKEAKFRLTGLKLDEHPPATLLPSIRPIFGQLDLRGEISSAGITLPLDQGTTATNLAAAMLNARATIELNGVAVTLPVKELASAAASGPKYPRMTKVSGRITLEGGEVVADLSGLLEDFPYKALLAWHGTTVDAPFECTFVSEGFQLRERPRLTPFLPERVSEKLAMFSNPTGVVDARVNVFRENKPDGSPGEPRVEGRLAFRDGVASFFRFPYQFRELHGVATFDDRSLTISRIEGSHPNGARLVATATVSPLTDEAEVTVKVEASNVPVDDVLEQGLGPRRRRIIGSLFNNERTAELLRRGLIVTPADHEQRVKEVAEAQAAADRLRVRRPAPDARDLAAAEQDLKRAQDRAKIPAFELGGRGSVTIDLHSPFGRNMPWDQTIVVTIPKAGMVPRRFPLPIVAQDVQIRIDDTTLTIPKGQWHGLTGGEAKVTVKADFSSEGGDGGDGTDVRIHASGIPIDSLLLNAIPGSDRPLRDEGPDKPPGTLAQVFHDLRIECMTDADVWIRETRPDELTFSADVKLDNLRATPRRDGEEDLPALVLQGDSCRLSVSDEKLSLKMSAKTVSTPDATPASVEIDANATFGPRDANDVPGNVGYSVVVDTKGLHVAEPIERVVGVFSPKAAVSLADLRGRYQPNGTADVLTSISAEPGGDTTVTAVVKPGATLEFAATPDGRRVAVGPTLGSATFIADARPRLMFDGLKGPLSAAADPGGQLSLDGTFFVIDSSGAAKGDSLVRIGFQNGAFESPITAMALDGRLGDRAQSGLAEWNPRGRFDLNLAVSRPAAAGADWSFEGAIRPSTLTVDTGGRSVNFHTVKGSISFSSTGGTFENLDLRGETFNAKAGGRWLILPDGSATLTMALSADAAGMPDDLVAFLPEDSRKTIRDLRVAVGGALSIPALNLSFGWPPEGGKESTFSASGSLRFLDLSGDFGVLVSGADGELTFSTSRDGVGKQTMELHADASSAKAADIALENIQLMVGGGERPGEIFIPLLTADCHKGRLSCEVVIKPQSDDPAAARAFSTRIDVSGVELEGLLSDSGAESAKPRGRSAIIDAGITLGGTLDDPTSRRGRGLVYLGGGEVLNLPFVLPLIEVSQFRIPSGEKLDTAKATLFIDGPMIAFESIRILSETVEFRGFGTLAWEDKSLDLLFNSRAARRIPVVSPLVEGIWNEIVTAEVTGTIKKPKVGLATLRGTRKIFTDAFGGATDRDRLMLEMERESPLNTDRLRVRAVPSPAPDAPNAPGASDGNN